MTKSLLIMPKGLVVDGRELIPVCCNVDGLQQVYVYIGSYYT